MSSRFGSFPRLETKRGMRRGFTTFAASHQGWVRDGAHWRRKGVTTFSPQKKMTTRQAWQARQKVGNA